MKHDCPSCGEEIHTTERAMFAGLIVCPDCGSMFAIR